MRPASGQIRDSFRRVVSAAYHLDHTTADLLTESLPAHCSGI